MKERPILFNSAMVRAILEGRKTQTRRVVKCDYRLLESKSVRDWAERLAGNGCYSRPITEDDIDKKANQLSGRLFPFLTEEAGVIGLSCPFGKAGDRLWVRETWRPSILHHCAMDACDCADVRVNYSAGGDLKYFAEDDVPEDWMMPKAALKGNNVPAIHMPRWASRITLEITDVRVERLQDISEEDAKAEGCWYGAGGRRPDPAVAPEDHFPTLWESITGAGSWEANPWVWVVEFQRLEHSPA